MDYMSERDCNFGQLKKKADSDNSEIDAEWFGDGKWQFNDDIAGIGEEDWEVWMDWFPD